MITSSRRHPLRLLFFSVSIILLAFAIEGCSKLQNTPAALQSPTGDKDKNSTDLAVLEISRLQTLQDIIPELGKYRAVLVGETHTEYGDHLNQLAIIKGLHTNLSSSGQKTLAIGLEMVQQPYQRFLDEYVAGSINELAMLRGTEWYERWRYDYRLYRPIFHYARKHAIPLVALNIPREMTRKISKSGIAGLSAEERRLLPQQIQTPSASYRKRLNQIFSMHATTRSDDFERFLQAQLAWDEGMAYSASRYLQRQPTSQMVILAGSGHVIREAMPIRIEKQIKSKTAIVLSYRDTPPNASEADYVLFASHKALSPAGKIGISMLDKPHGVIIEEVLPKRAGAKAGLLDGDRITRLDGQPVKTSTDVRLWALDKEPGDKATIQVERNGKLKTFSITLDGAPRLGFHGMR